MLSTVRATTWPLARPGTSAVVASKGQSAAPATSGAAQLSHSQTLPLTDASPALQAQPGAKDSSTKSNKRLDFFYSHHQISNRKLWQFWDKLHEKFSLCWEETL